MECEGKPRDVQPILVPRKGDLGTLNKQSKDGNDGVNREILSEQTCPPEGASSLTENNLERNESTHRWKNAEEDVEWTRAEDKPQNSSKEPNTFEPWSPR